MTNEEEMERKRRIDEQFREHQARWVNSGEVYQLGPDLRDQFAMAALTGILAREDTNLESDPDSEEYSAWDDAAQAAYFLADAMMKEREK